MIRAVLCDLSGVLYVGDRPVPGAVDALVSLRAAGVGVRFITNVTRLPRRRIVEKLSRLGFEIDAEDVFTPSAAARTYVTQESLVPHLLIHPNLQEELGDLAGPAPNAVLVGDAGHAFTYENLNAAFRVLIRGAPLLAMGTNRYYRESDGLSLDLGPFVKALTYASGAPTVVLGKPSSAFFRLAAASLGVDLEDVVMVGDDYEVDVRGALDAGLQAILVRTGKYRDGDECRVGVKGTRVCADIGEATDLIL
jgi:HAD superfamily hydrolase (TIGR01458 family)